MGDSSLPLVPVLDIRSDKFEKSLLDVLRQSLKPNDDNPKTMPTLLLYDEMGLKIFEEITYLDEYYLTNAEIEVLKTYADEIAARIPKGSRLVELGSGNLRKVNILLNAFETAKKEVEYYALDLSLAELNRTFSEIDAASYNYVSLRALHGTYDDGLAWLEATKQKNKSTCVMTLGSSLGNFTRTEAADFLASFKQILQPSDYMLVGLDACQDTKRVFAAYNDAENVTERFYRNGLEHANKLLGYKAFRQEDWRIEGVYDSVENRHSASYVALKDVDTKDFSIKNGDKLHLEDAFKYSEEESDKLWYNAGLIPHRAFANTKEDYFLHLLSPSDTQFATAAVDYAAHPVPTIEDWQELWSAWDTVTKSMVPRDELMNKPIQLRNNLIFYLGHIPTFADIHFTRATAAKPTNPAYYVKIFERGIDPDVDNPELCHDHSEIPDTWPPLGEILDYQARVRARIIDSIENGAADKDRKLGRGLWLAYEHEAMHLETFLYMLLQSEKILPPPATPTPDFKSLAKRAAENRCENKWHNIPTSKIKIGLDDPENNHGPDRYFGWDNERPSRNVTVEAFQTQSRPISNGEYAHFLEITHSKQIPASWTTLKPKQNGAHHNSELNGSHEEKLVTGLPTSSFLDGKAIRTVFGPVELQYALDWPVMASYDELAAYARWSDGRIPTFEEVRSIYNYVESSILSCEKVPSTLISAVNGHLCNEGVEETPPSQPYLNGIANGATTSLNPNDLFIDLGGRNVAFQQWHPTPVTGNNGKLCGQGDVGGLWEWTSTHLASFEGFKAMDLYPGYTADFFDDKHNICLGGSWATAPRIAGRKSFVNWYQRNYPYVWCTARLVRDLPAQ